ncbi:2OG-Fe(II) oxygenase [Actinoallomurus purpureus]|uniref:2OG-Fe(II) oxygenase n=1 Tax=Actinoallomurus purpureus TaxID=478114 RepID=UPI003556928E
MLTVARDWAARLGRAAPWPDDLDAWIAMCHDAGQDRSAQILLRYEAGDWNALHRDACSGRWCSPAGRGRPRRAGH